MLVSGDLPGTWELLALSCYQTGELGECVKYCTVLLKADPYRPTALVLFLRAFQKEGGDSGENAEAVAAFLERLYHMERQKDRLLLLRAASETGYSKLEELIRQKCPEMELQEFDRAMAGYKGKTEGTKEFE